jgi:hypothetical protein
MAYRVARVVKVSSKERFKNNSSTFVLKRKTALLIRATE